MITEAGMTEMDAAALMSIRKPRDHSHENKRRSRPKAVSFWTNAQHLCSRIQENV